MPQKGGKGLRFREEAKVKGMIYVDPEKCMGCHTCEIACAVAHSGSKELLKAIHEEPRPRPRVVVEAVGGAAVPLQCRHCEDAPCVAICPTGAMAKLDGGPVVVREELCIGCKACMLVCPFGAVTMRPEGKAVHKCDLCIERLEAGEEPACASACPTGALRFGPVEEVVREARRKAAERFLVSFERREQVVA